MFQHRPAPWRGAVLAALLASVAGLASLPFAASAQADQIDATSKVTGALVYPRGATVERVAEFAAPAGRHEVVIADLPVDLDVDSLRVAGAVEIAAGAAAPALEILGISHKIREPRVEPLSEPERQALLDQIEALEWELRAAEDSVAEASARLDYMAAFRRATVGRPPFFGPRRKRKVAEADSQRIPPQGARGDAGLFEVSERWADSWALIASESAAARQSLREAERQREKIGEDIAKLRDALDQVGPPPPARSVLTVSIAASGAIEDGALSIEYLTSRARWAPIYDLKLDTAAAKRPGLDGALTLARRASVTQSTGEAWEGVRLAISTARPTGRVIAPNPRALRAILEPIAPERSRDDAFGNKRAVTGAFKAQSEQALAGGAAEEPSPAPMMAQRMDTPSMERVLSREAETLAQYSGAGAVYEIREPARIPGDGEARQVLIGAETVEVDLVARATPSREQTAYLYAMHQNLEAPLLPGRASIYRDGVFYGQFRLDYVAPGDETALPFGPLDEVKVSHRVITRSQGEEGLFSTSNRQQSRFELTAKNLGEQPRKITLFDARPFTETEEIKITFTGQSPTQTEVEGRRGVVAWTFELEPETDREIRFGYDVSWPEGRKMRITK